MNKFMFKLSPEAAKVFSNDPEPVQVVLEQRG